MAFRQQETSDKRLWRDIMWSELDLDEMIEDESQDNLYQDTTATEYFKKQDSARPPVYVPTMRWEDPLNSTKTRMSRSPDRMESFNRKLRIWHGMRSKDDSYKDFLYKKKYERDVPDEMMNSTTFGNYTDADFSDAFADEFPSDEPSRSSESSGLSIFNSSDSSSTKEIGREILRTFVWQILILDPDMRNSFLQEYKGSEDPAIKSRNNAYCDVMLDAIRKSFEGSLQARSGPRKNVSRTLRGSMLERNKQRRLKREILEKTLDVGNYLRNLYREPREKKSLEETLDMQLDKFFESHEKSSKKPSNMKKNIRKLIQFWEMFMP